MSRYLKWGLAAFGVYVLFLIYHLPATQVLSRVTLPDSVSLSDISGTVWQGEAKTVSIQGIPVDKLHWDVNVLALLIGSLSADLKAGNVRATDEIAFSGPVSVSLFNANHFSLSDFNLYLPSNLVIAQMPLPIPVDAGGRFRVQLEEADFPGRCETLSGKGQWLNASIEGLGEPVNMGTFEAALSCLEGDTLLDIQEPNAFGLSARARVPMNMQITVEGRFKPADSLPKAVHDAAKFFGQPDADGYYPIVF